MSRNSWRHLTLSKALLAHKSPDYFLGSFVQFETDLRPNWLLVLQDYLLPDTATI